MTRVLLTSLAVFGAMSLASRPAPQAAPPYRNAALPVDERVADLVARMTLAEKVAQLEGLWVRNGQITDASGRFDPAKAATVLANGLGQISRPSEIAGSPNGPRLRSPREQAEFATA